jgi:hypothetical protein
MGKDLNAYAKGIRNMVSIPKIRNSIATRLNCIEYGFEPDSIGL